jgi:nicotinate-nucleotide pyrophosphorylase
MDDIDRYLLEDLGKEGDITSDALFTNEKANAVIIAKESCVIAGLEELKKCYYLKKVSQAHPIHLKFFGAFYRLYATILS